MRQRPSARLLVLNDKDKIFLFRFVHKQGPLAGQNYRATPGGAVEADETFQQAASRELREETGLECSQFNAEVARREFVLQLADGEFVDADERYFVVRADAEQLSFVGWTDLEVEVMAEHKWWPWLKIAETKETIWQENLLAILTSRPAREGSKSQAAVDKARAFLAGRSNQGHSDGYAKLEADGKW